MFRKILIANRGEIALRVIDACKELGIATVAVYSEADRNSLHVRFADEAVCIGPPRSSESYLNIPQVISAAEITNVDAIHPGYGFLSENANFAEVCEASHITFIGPSPELLRMMGEKDQARREMATAGVPVVPGSLGIVPDEAPALPGAARIKYPVMLKASAGGRVEFLMDEDGSVYFIEMNARIQVEHPVTEMVTGVDLVKSQIRLAAGEKLADVVGNPVTRGHAIECRVNAEDPETFVPSPGRITVFRVPGGPGIRVDTAAYADAIIPPYYDSLIAKLIAFGDTREESIARMRRALEMFVVEGIKTSIPLHRKILADADFAAGRLDTHFLDRFATVLAG